jgi:hypothetical protein
MLNKILDIIFGKAPDIFDAKGGVLHKLPEERWTQWHARFKKSEFDWRQHKGTERKVESPVKK